MNGAIAKRGNLMDKYQCEVEVGRSGFLGMGGKIKCNKPTSFRCPNCGNAVCEQCGTEFRWRWSYHVFMGLVCSGNCLKGLFANGATTKGWFTGNSSEVAEWAGMGYNTSKESAGFGDFNGRKMDDLDYYHQCAPYSSQEGYKAFRLWLKNKSQ